MAGVLFVIGNLDLLSSLGIRPSSFFSNLLSERFISTAPIVIRSSVPRIFGRGNKRDHQVRTRLLSLLRDSASGRISHERTPQSSAIRILRNVFHDDFGFSGKSGMGVHHRVC